MWLDWGLLTSTTYFVFWKPGKTGMMFVPSNYVVTDSGLNLGKYIFFLKDPSKAVIFDIERILK